MPSIWPWGGFGWLASSRLYFCFLLSNLPDSTPEVEPAAKRRKRRSSAQPHCPSRRSLPGGLGTGQFQRQRRCPPPVQRRHRQSPQPKDAPPTLDGPVAQSRSRLGPLTASETAHPGAELDAALASEALRQADIELGSSFHFHGANRCASVNNARNCRNSLRS